MIIIFDNKIYLKLMFPLIQSYIISQINLRIIVTRFWITQYFKNRLIVFYRVFAQSRYCENILWQSSCRYVDKRRTTVRLGSWKLRSTGFGKFTRLASYITL